MVQDATISGIEALIEKLTGLKLQVIGKSWERLLLNRMEHLGVVSFQRYYDLLQDSRSERQALIELIVVPETSFFRDRAAIDYLVQMISRVDYSRHPLPWRILSVGCSTGEEPYSIAMALLDSHVSSSRFKIVGCDVSRVALEAAKKAIYNKNSFRGHDLRYRDVYFDSKEGGQYQLCDNVMNLVKFKLLNIVDNLSLILGANLIDAIFFRNVLVYLGAEAQEQALSHCRKLLTPGGLLFVGLTEVELVKSRGFASMGVARACAFHVEVAKLHKEKRAHQEIFSNSEIAEEDRKKLLEEAQRLADGGEIDLGIMACHRYISIYGGTEEIFFLMGMLETSARCDQMAERYFKKALYLKPDHYEALINLALIAERSGKLQESLRYWKHARRVFKTHLTHRERHLD